MTSVIVFASVTDPSTVSAVWLVMKLLVGAVMVMAGGVVSSLPATAAVPRFPAASCAVTVRVLEPSASVTPAVKVDPTRLAAWPFTLTDAMLLASLTLPVTVMAAWLVRKLAAGPVIVMAGPTVSSLPVTVAVPVSPAESRAVTVIVLDPSVNVRLVAKPPPLGVTLWPFTVSSTIVPVVPTDPLTAICDPLVRKPVTGAVIVTVGGTVLPAAVNV